MRTSRCGSGISASCTGEGTRRIRIQGHYIMPVCSACAPKAYLSEYRKQWNDGIAFDRGRATRGYAWSLPALPPPWERPEDDPRPDDEKTESLARLTGDPVTRHFVTWE